MSKTPSGFHRNKDAGTITPVANLNALKSTATYTGHMVGDVQNGANAYVAAGTYTNQWSFGTRSGIATMTFDGATFGGGKIPNTMAVSSTSFFTTPMPLISSNGRSITLNGAFVSSPSAAAAGQGGNFAITGPACRLLGSCPLLAAAPATASPTVEADFSQGPHGLSVKLSV